MPRLLVTGFGPFPGMPRNPSGALARAVAGAPRWRLVGVAAEALVLETRYGAIAGALEPELARFRPDALLMIGVAGRAKRVRVETRAVNRASRLLPDASGRKLATLTLAPGPLLRRTTGRPGAALARLKGRGVPAALSGDAGRYLCNAAYFAVLQAPRPTLFLHVPRPPRPRPGPRRRRRLGWSEGLAAAFADVAQGLLVESLLALRPRRR